MINYKFWIHWSKIADKLAVLLWRNFFCFSEEFFFAVLSPNLIIVEDQFIPSPPNCPAHENDSHHEELTLHLIFDYIAITFLKVPRAWIVFRFKIPQHCWAKGQCQNRCSTVLSTMREQISQLYESKAIFFLLRIFLVLSYLLAVTNKRPCVLVDNMISIAI